MTKAANDLDRLRIRLNDRQSDIFLKLRNRRSASNCNYDMSIKNCQAIQKSCLDGDCNAWFTLGSAQPSVTNHACFRYGWRNGKIFTKFIFIHIHDRNIHLTFSAHHLCASVSIKYGLRITDYGLRTGYKTRTQV